MYTHPFFEATPPGAAPGPPVNTGARVRHFRGCNQMVFEEARGDVHPQARFVKFQDRIAQRPQMARSTRFAESIYKLKESIRNYVIERSWDLF